MNVPATNESLAGLEVGLRTDVSHLLQFEEDLMRSLRRANDLGAEFGSPGDWSAAWRYHWQRVETILQRLRGRVEEMDWAITNHEPERFTTAYNAFEGLKSDDAELMQALAGLREQAAGLNPAAQAEWKALIPVLERHLYLIHSCAQSLLLKLEMLKEHSHEEVDLLVRNFASSPLPPFEAKAGDAPQAPELVEAAKELGKEHHKFMGWLDVIQGMFLWVENPEERVRKKMSLD